MKMRHLFILLVAGLLMLGAAIYLSQGQAVAAAAKKKPVDIIVHDINGKVVKFADLRGKVVLVDTWATWCGYCVAEIPDLMKLQQKATEKHWNLQIVGMSIDRDKGAVKTFADQRKMNYPVVYAENALKQLGDVPGVPTKFLIDEKGVVVDTHIGAMEYNDIEKFVAKHVKVVKEAKPAK